MKNQKGFSVFILLVLIAVIGSVMGVGFFVYSQNQNILSKNSSPTTVLSNDQQHLTFKSSSNSLNQKATQSAEAFLISKVGEERFHKYFKFDASKSSDTDPKDSNIDSRAYHFSLLKTVADDDLIVVQVDRNIDSQTFANLVPDCVKDASFCNFSTTRQQALSIAKSNGFMASDLKTSWDPFHDSPNLAIKVSSCKQNKSMWIDYRNGKITGFEKDLICGGTP